MEHLKTDPKLSKSCFKRVCYGRFVVSSGVVSMRFGGVSLTCYIYLIRFEKSKITNKSFWRNYMKVCKGRKQNSMKRKIVGW